MYHILISVTGRSRYDGGVDGSQLNLARLQDIFDTRNRAEDDRWFAGETSLSTLFRVTIHTSQVRGGLNNFLKKSLNALRTYFELHIWKCWNCVWERPSCLLQAVCLVHHALHSYENAKFSIIVRHIEIKFLCKLVASLMKLGYALEILAFVDSSLQSHSCYSRSDLKAINDHK